MPKPPDLIGTVTAAAIIGVERSTISRWVQLGRMTPALRLEGQTGAYLFTRAEVDRMATEYARRVPA